MSCRRSGQADAGPSQAQPDTDDEAEAEEAAADSLAAGESGALEAEVGTTGSQCAHVCCQELRVCICKELELVRVTYSGQGTDQFRAKVSNTGHGWLVAVITGGFAPARACCDVMLYRLAVSHQQPGV